MYYILELTVRKAHINPVLHLISFTCRFDVECPAYSTLDIGESLPLCPTYQELDSDNTRIPSDIIQTRCRCDHCVLRHRHRQQNLCKPVVRHIPVLRKLGCKDGIYEYGEFLEGVSVTCVCEIKPGSHEKHERARDSDLEESVNIMEESEPTTSGQYTNSRKMLDDFHEVAGLSDSDQLVVDNSPQQDPSTEYTDTEKMPG